MKTYFTKNLFRSFAALFLFISVHNAEAMPETGYCMSNAPALMKSFPHYIQDGYVFIKWELFDDQGTSKFRSNLEFSNDTKSKILGTQLSSDRAVMFFNGVYNNGTSEIYYVIFYDGKGWDISYITRVNGTTGPKPLYNPQSLSWIIGNRDGKNILQAGATFPLLCQVNDMSKGEKPQMQSIYYIPASSEKSSGNTLDKQISKTNKNKPTDTYKSYIAHTGSYTTYSFNDGGNVSSSLSGDGSIPSNSSGSGSSPSGSSSDNKKGSGLDMVFCVFNDPDLNKMRYASWVQRTPDGLDRSGTVVSKGTKLFSSIHPYNAVDIQASTLDPYKLVINDTPFDEEVLTFSSIPKPKEGTPGVQTAHLEKTLPLPKSVEDEMFKRSDHRKKMPLKVNITKKDGTYKKDVLAMCHISINPDSNELGVMRGIVGGVLAPEDNVKISDALAQEQIARLAAAPKIYFCAFRKADKLIKKDSEIRYIAMTAKPEAFSAWPFAIVSSFLNPVSGAFTRVAIDDRRMPGVNNNFVLMPEDNTEEIETLALGFKMSKLGLGISDKGIEDKEVWSISGLYKGNTMLDKRPVLCVKLEVPAAQDAAEKLAQSVAATVQNSWKTAPKEGSDSSSSSSGTGSSSGSGGPKEEIATCLSDSGVKVVKVVDEKGKTTEKTIPNYSDTTINWKYKYDIPPVFKISINEQQFDSNSSDMHFLVNYSSLSGHISKIWSSDYRWILTYLGNDVVPPQTRQPWRLEVLNDKGQVDQTRQLTCTITDATVPWQLQETRTNPRLSGKFSFSYCSSGQCVRQPPPPPPGDKTLEHKDKSAYEEKGD